MGNEKKKAIGKITPKKVKAVRKADGSIEILDEPASQSKETEGSLGDLSFSDRDSLLESLQEESDILDNLK